MSYSLNGVPLSSFGFIPGQQKDSNLALLGFLDMPARIGKTFHNWAEKKGVQPYVSASEIRFGGRTLKLTGHILGTDKPDCLAKSKALIALVDGLTTLVPLSSQWGAFNVIVKSISIDFVADTALSVNIEMREPIVNITGTMPTADDGQGCCVLLFIT